MSDSLQHKLDRVRRPRVQITYDVETGGATKKTELAFVVGYSRAYNPRLGAIQSARCGFDLIIRG